MKKIYLPMVSIAVLILISCTAGPNQLVNSPGEIGDIAGFWLGLWHGFISLFSLVVSLFSDSVSIYEVHNNGTWYNLGFVLGVMCFFGGSGGGAGRKSKWI